MKRIGILSDTHSMLPEGTTEFFSECDEIWHAGDVGMFDVISRLEAITTLRGVYGNIDGQDVRHFFPETNAFNCEEVKVLIQHIGGYPNRYTPSMRQAILREKPDLVITGHSHILKVMYDKKYEHLHINPGSAGMNGLHSLRTMVRLSIDGKNIKDLEIRELPR